MQLLHRMICFQKGGSNHERFWTTPGEWKTRSKYEQIEDRSTQVSPFNSWFLSFEGGFDIACFLPSKRYRQEQFSIEILALWNLDGKSGQKYFDVVPWSAEVPVKPIRLSVYRNGPANWKIIFRTHWNDALSGSIKAVIGITDLTGPSALMG